MKKGTAILLGFIALKFVIQYVAVNPVYELQRDEYLHLDQGLHLAWGYISVAPFTSWVAWLIRLLGNGVFWVRFFPALFGALTLLLVWKIIGTLKGNLYAQCLGATAIVFSALARLNILFQPNSSDILCWTLFYYIAIQYISTENTKWLYWAGVVAGFGFLSKYNFAFLLMGLLPAILITPHRLLFKQKALYMAVGIAFIMVLPNLLWQYQNHFPTLRQLDELVRTQLDNVERFDFIKQQFLFFINSIFLILIAIIALLFYKPFKPYRFILYGFIFTISVYIFLKAKGYYAIGLYPVLIAFGSVYAGRLLQNGWKKYLQPVLLLWVVVFSIPLLMVALPYNTPSQIKQHDFLYRKLGLLKWEDGKEHALPQDFADMQGWKEMAAKTDSIYASLPDKENTLVLCDNYGQAGAINYYSSFKNINAVSFNADYINWMPLDKNINNVIFVKYHRDSDTARLKEIPLFEKVMLKARVENTNAIENGARIYLLQHALVSINDRIKKEIADREK